MTSSEKSCTTCGVSKPVSQFYLRKGKPRSNCKECVRLSVKTTSDQGLKQARDKARYKIKGHSILAQQQESRLQNTDVVNQLRRDWYRQNRDQVMQRRMQWQSKVGYWRASYGPLIALKRGLRKRLSEFIKYRGMRSISMTEALGCSWPELKIHLERQFPAGISWDNRSEWHIDHIIPLASAKTAEEAIQLSHFTNLRPLWAADNLAKSDKQ